MWSRSIFPAAGSQGLGFLRQHLELCTASPANIKPLCSIQVSLMRGSSLSRLDLAWWREVDVEAGVALRCCSETSAVVLVSCGGLCLAHAKPALCSAITTERCWVGGWSGGSLLAGARCQQSCSVLVSHLALQPSRPKPFSITVLSQGSGKAVATSFWPEVWVAPNRVSSLGSHGAKKQFEKSDWIMTILSAKRIFTSCLIHFHPFWWWGLWWDILVLCLFLLSAPRWTSRPQLPDCALPSLLLALGAVQGAERCHLAIRSCVCQVWPCPAHLHPCFIFLHTLGRVEPSPVWFVGFLKNSLFMSTSWLPLLLI